MAELVTLMMNSPSIMYLCRQDRCLAKVIHMIGPISYRTHDGEQTFPFLVHEIIEQMLSAKAGHAIFVRLNQECGGCVTPQAIRELSCDTLRSVGMSMAKAQCIRGMADAALNGSLDFMRLASLPDEGVIAELTQFRGIGPWTAKMCLIFVFNRPDVLPVEDGAFLQTYRWVYKTENDSADDVRNRCRNWSPYASIGARFFYRALDLGLNSN